MTDFAKKDEIEALEEVVDRDHVIFENDGVFQIAKNLDYSAAQYNTEFKALVDSVLHQQGSKLPVSICISSVAVYSL